jgi:hypothetical protein
MMDSSVLARMDMASDLEDHERLSKGDLTVRPKRASLRAVSAGPVWFYLESSREWFWRDEQNRYWLVHSSRRGVALPQMEFFMPPGLKPVNPRSKKGPRLPPQAKAVVSALECDSISS